MNLEYNSAEANEKNKQLLLRKKSRPQAQRHTGECEHHKTPLPR